MASSNTSSPQKFATFFNLPQTPAPALLRVRSTTSLSSSYEQYPDSPPSSYPSRNHSTTNLSTPLLTKAALPSKTTPIPQTNFFTTLPARNASPATVLAWLVSWFTINYSFLDPASTPAITDYLTRLSLTAAHIHTLSGVELHQIFSAGTASLGGRCVEALRRLAEDVVKAREDGERGDGQGGGGGGGENGKGEVRFFLEVESKGKWGKVRGDKGWVNDEGRWGIEETFSERLKSGVKEKVGGVKEMVVEVKEKVGGVLGKTGVVLGKADGVFGIVANRFAGLEREKITGGNGRAD